MATSLRVVAKPILMVHSILLQESFQFLLYEVRPIITDYHPRDAKARENDLLKKFDHYYGVIGRASHGLHLLGDIIHYNEDVFVTP